MDVKVAVNSVNADRLFPVEKPNPTNTDISLELNPHSFERRSKNMGKIDFTMTISYTPGVAQLKISGDAIVRGEEEEIEDLKKDVPSPIMRSILDTTLTKATQVSDMINAPSPFPLPEDMVMGEAEAQEVGKEYG